ncbi:hypothetical protein DWY47_18480, partial [Ruminococcus sp. AF25-23LB]
HYISTDFSLDSCKYFKIFFIKGKGLSVNEYVRISVWILANTLKFFLLKERGYRLMNMYPSR